MSSTEGTQSRASSPARLTEMPTVNWPLRDDPGHAWTTLGACIVLGIISGVLSGSWHMGLLSGLALSGAVWKLWLPITCELGSRGITLTVLRWRRVAEWREVDHLEVGGRGVFICPERERTSLASLRQIYLPWRFGRDEAVKKTRSSQPRVRPTDSTATWDGHQLKDGAF